MDVTEVAVTALEPAAIAALAAGFDALAGAIVRSILFLVGTVAGVGAGLSFWREVT